MPFCRGHGFKWWAEKHEQWLYGTYRLFLIWGFSKTITQESVCQNFRRVCNPYLLKRTCKLRESKLKSTFGVHLTHSIIFMLPYILKGPPYRRLGHSPFCKFMTAMTILSPTLGVFAMCYSQSNQFAHEKIEFWEVKKQCPRLYNYSKH